MCIEKLHLNFQKKKLLKKQKELIKSLTNCRNKSNSTADNFNFSQIPTNNSTFQFANFLLYSAKKIASFKSCKKLFFYPSALFTLHSDKIVAFFTSQSRFSISSLLASFIFFFKHSKCQIHILPIYRPFTVSFIRHLLG